MTLLIFASNFVSGCMQGHIYETMGTITSPGFPEDYLNNLTCYWIVVPRLLQQYRLVLVFDTFNTENIDRQPNCT